MAKTWYPIIHEDLCIACGTCVEFCPHEVFVQLDGSTPQVVNPDNCVEFCRGCSKVCPEGAITYFGDEE
ncbi:MAG: 4Fe-4S dicluster domain-containing protein [Anaerolineae bacterium]